MKDHASMTKISSKTLMLHKIFGYISVIISIVVIFFNKNFLHFDMILMGA